MTKLVYIIYAHFEAKPGNEELVKSILTSLVEPTLKEEGCLRYDFYFSASNPAKFLIHEYWKNGEAHDLHMTMDYIMIWQTRKRELLANFYDITMTRDLSFEKLWLQKK